MSQVVSGVTEKLQDLLPGLIGSNLRWTTTDVERHIMLADRAVRERTGNLYHRQEIALVADTLEYTLDSEFIEIISVEYASDGSTYDHYLHPVTLDDLDKVNMNWRDDGGTRPEAYCVLSAPGTPTCKLLVYRPMSSVDSQTIRVTGLGIGATTTPVPDDVQMRCHVPYVMAVLKASESPDEAAEWFGQYLAGCDEVRSRSLSKYPKGLTDVRIGW
jgi:hypothetical protein